MSTIRDAKTGKVIGEIVACPEGRKIIFASAEAKAAFQKAMGQPVDPDEEYFVGHKH